MAESTLAAVDLGSNSFRLQVARVEQDQIYPLDSLREPVRLAAGVGADKRLDEASQQRALECLKRFGERLRGMPVWTSIPSRAMETGKLCNTMLNRSIWREAGS